MLKPKLHSAHSAEERRATWLELFYDLIFVVAISQLAYVLAKDVSWLGLLKFMLLFVPVWWCWVGATFYVTRFNADPISERLFALVQMGIVAVMAAMIHQGLSASVGFALCYIAFRGILVLQYLYSGWHIPPVRPLIRWYAGGFSLSILLWLGSILVPEPWRYCLWVLGLLVDFGTPLSAGKLVAQFPPSMTHIPERVGLFTIIVLGEDILAVVNSLSNMQWGAGTIAVALLGLSFAFAIWWLYFDTVDGSPLKAMTKGRMGTGIIWLYAHLPMTMGIIMMGVGVEHFLAHGISHAPKVGDRWLMFGGMALIFTMLAWIHWITCTLGGTAKRRKIISAYRFAGALGLLLIAAIAQDLSAVGLMILATGMSVLQVGLDLWVNPKKIS
jgi:low temperature requirement protein LtrA